MTASRHGGSERNSALVVVDAVVTGVVASFLVLEGGLTMFYAVMYFASGVDGCTGGMPCAERDRAELAILVLCVGVVGSWIVAAAGTVTCAVRRRFAWYWPLLGLLIASTATWWGFRMAIDAGGL